MWILYKILEKGKKFDVNFNPKKFVTLALYILWKRWNQHNGDRIVRIGITKGNITLKHIILTQNAEAFLEKTVELFCEMTNLFLNNGITKTLKNIELKNK